jgi:hypothetical protein
MLYSPPVSIHASLIMKNKGALEKKTYRQLRSLAAKAGIAGRSSMNKSRLMGALARPKKSGSASPPPKLAAAAAAPDDKRAVHPRPSARRASPRGKPASVGMASEKARRPFREATELPAGYGRTQLTLMEVDPHRVHAFWEVTRADREAAKRRLNSGAARAPWVLRVHEATPPGSGRPHAPRHFDVPVDLAPGNWYVDVPTDGCVYEAELGLITDSGRFEPACKSNAVRVPRSGLSERYAPRWLEVTDGYSVLQNVAEPPSDPALPPRYAPPTPPVGKKPKLFPRVATAAVRAIREPLTEAASAAEGREAEARTPLEYAEVATVASLRLPGTEDGVSSFSWNSGSGESSDAGRAARQEPRGST